MTSEQCLVILTAMCSREIYMSIHSVDIHVLGSVGAIKGSTLGSEAH